jgi:glutathione S-transferase
MLKILGRVTSINVRKVLWTADEAGLAYDREDWGMPIRDPGTPEFLKLNPNGLVPVLIDDGFVLWESDAIMRYLAEAAPSRGLIPANRQDRATMGQWLSWQGGELAPCWRYAFLALGRPTPGYDDPQQIAASIERWSARMAVLEESLADGRGYIAGARLSLADIALAVALHRWFAVSFEKPELPRVGAYYARLRERPAAVAYLGEGTP